jgi:tetratricopeptide (TPR) repeat protein
MHFSAPLVALATLFAFASPALADSHRDIGQCNFAGEISKADEGIAACDRVLSDPSVTGPGRATAFSNRCGWRWVKKDPDRALSDCNEAIRIDPGNAAAYMNRGNTYLNKGDIESAFADFNDAIRLNPKNAWAYSARAELFKSRGDLDHALSDLNESLRLDPNYAMPWFVRGDVYKRHGDLDHALADLNESIRLDANYAPAYFLRGSVYYLLGKATVALDDFGKSIQLAPDNPAAYFNRGVAYFVIGGRIADAEADFKKASEFNPGDAYAALWFDLARRRNNAPSRLAEAARRLDMNVWPAAVVHEFLGESSAAQTLAAANADDPKTKLGQTCEANFYSGELALLKNSKQDALRQLRLAASDCPSGFLESTAAIAELIGQH